MQQPLLLFMMMEDMQPHRSHVLYRHQYHVASSLAAAYTH